MLLKVACSQGREPRKRSHVIPAQKLAPVQVGGGNPGKTGKNDAILQRFEKNSPYSAAVALITATERRRFLFRFCHGRKARAK